MIFIFLKNKKNLIFILLFSLVFYISLMTASIFINTYYFFLKTFSTEDTVLIYNSKAISPVTSSLPTSLYNKIANIKGVLAVSPEIISITQYNNSILIVVRGIDITLFSKMQKMEIIEGRNLNIKDGYVALAGIKLTEKLNLKINQTIILFSSFTNRILELKVVGKFKTNTVIDQELLVPLFVASWLNGYSTDYVSFFRIKIDNKVTNMEEISKIITEESSANEKPRTTLDNLVYYLASRSEEKPAVKLVKGERALENVIINRLKINENVIIGLIIVIIFLFSLILKNIIKFFFYEKEKEADILFKLGLSKNKIIHTFFIYLLILINISFVIIILFFIFIKDYIQNLINISLFSYSINLNLDLNYFILIYILLIFLTIIYTFSIKYE